MDMTNLDSLLPAQSLEAEMAVIGSLLIDVEAFDKLAGILQAEHFYFPEHVIIYRAIYWLNKEEKAVDILTVSEYLAGNNELDKIGGLAKLGDIAKNTVSSYNCVQYAQIVKDKYLRRSLVSFSNEVMSLVTNPSNEDSQSIINDTEKRLYKIAELNATAKDYRMISDVLTDAVDELDKRFSSNSALSGISSGFSELDRFTGGLQPGELIIIAGRPSMGKTTVALNIAEHVAMTQPKGVAIFSLEMSAVALANKIIASLGRVSLARIKSGKLDDCDWPRLTSSISLISSKKMIFIESRDQVQEIRSLARRISREQGGLSLIVIDYLQMMRASTKVESRVYEIGEISRGIKLLAMELQIPIILLSQLNRDCEKRPDSRPKMADLRDSGSIEQDSDVIAFVFREEVSAKKKLEPGQFLDPSLEGKAEIIIEKNRNGETGTFILRFEGEYSKFSNMIGG